MDKAKLEKNTLNLVMIAFFILLIIYFPNLKKFEDYFIYGATALFSLHFWYGAFFFIKTLGPTRNILELLIGILILGLKIGSVYTITFMPLWFLVNGFLMGLGVVKYHIASKKEKTKKKKKFIFKKIAIELLTISAFFVLAILVWKIDVNLFRQVLSVVVLVIQLPFLYWIFFKEKVYKIVK